MEEEEEEEEQKRREEMKSYIQILVFAPYFVTSVCVVPEVNYSSKHETQPTFLSM